MFLFKSTKQIKQPKRQLDFNLKILLDVVSTNSQNSLTKKSTMKAFYNQLQKKIVENWPQFIAKYDRQIIRIKKSLSTWNYSDIRVVKHCIKKSIEQDSLSVLAEKWCEIAIVSLFQTGVDSSRNDCESQKQIIQNIQQKMKTEIFILCSLLFRFVFQIYGAFFVRYYDQKNKSNGNIKLKKSQIYQKQRYIYEDFIRNCLTNLYSFSHIYKLYLVKSAYPSINNCLQEKETINRQFQQFLKFQLKIQQDFKLVYINAANAIKQFHYEPQIELKIEKACNIIPSIQKDNMELFKRNNLQVTNKIETITTPMLSYLFKIYCPYIETSIDYIKMMICYRLKTKQQQENFQKLIQQYCFLWLHEGVSAKLQVILDVFTFQ